MFYRDSQKISRLKDLMRQGGIDVLLLQLPENVCYVSDYWPLLGLTFVVFPADGDPTLVHNNFETEPETWIHDVRRFSAESPKKVEDPIENALKCVRDSLPEGKITLGLETSFNSIGTGYLKYRANAVTPSLFSRMKKTFRNAKLADATSIIYDARLIKTKMEYERLRVANEVSSIGLKTMYEGLEDGIRELDLATRIERETIIQGTGRNQARHIMACAFVSSGPFTAETYGVCFGNSLRKIRRGDFVMLEFDVVVDGYSSDMSRTYVVGSPSPKQENLLESVYQAQTEAVELERDGVMARDVNKQAERIIIRDGYGKYVRHYFGHGVGVTIWEPRPYIHSSSTDTLRAGMVHSAEPGVYIPGFGGVRIEDNIFVSSRSPIYLSKYMPIQE